MVAENLELKNSIRTHMRLGIAGGSLPTGTCVTSLTYSGNAVQETKLQEQHVADAQQELGLDGWSHHWNCSTIMKGYSGTAIISRRVLMLSACNSTYMRLPWHQHICQLAACSHAAAISSSRNVNAQSCHDIMSAVQHSAWSARALRHLC